MQNLCALFHWQREFRGHVHATNRVSHQFLVHRVVWHIHVGFRLNASAEHFPDNPAQDGHAPRNDDQPEKVPQYATHILSLILSAASILTCSSEQAGSVEPSVCRASQGVKRKAVISRGCAAYWFRERAL
jgi:hypothetical protein